MVATPSRTPAGAPVGRGPDLDSLPYTVPGRPPPTVHVDDPGGIADTLRRVAEVGPYFAVTTGPVVESDWRPVRTLYENPAVLGSLLDRIQVRIGAEQARVAASILFQGHAARLWSVSLGTLIYRQQIPDLNPDALLWRDQDGTMRLHLQRAEGWRGENLGDVLGHRVITNHLAPLIIAIHRLGPLAERLLWGNAASALLGAARVLDDATTGPAQDVAGQLLMQGPLRGTIRQRPDGEHRRRSCCLFYRIPGGSLCGDCALSQPPIPQPKQTP